MNNGGKCIESRYTTKSSDTMILDGEQTLDFDPPYDLIYLWCSCPDPSAQVHFEYQSSRFPKQLVVPDTNRQIQVEENEILLIPTPNVRDKHDNTTSKLPSITTKDINSSITNVTTNVITQIPQGEEENLVLEKTLAIIIVVVIAVTALVLTFFLARCFMKQSSIGQMEDDKGCKQSAKAWIDENLSFLRRLKGRGQDQLSQNDIAQANDIQQVEHVDIHIDEEDTSRPDQNFENSEVQLAAVPSIIRKNETPDKNILVLEH